MQHTILDSETILDIFEHTLKYSNQAKQIYLTYSWFEFIKQYIFCNSIIHKNNSFLVSRILTLTACTPTLTSLRLNPQSAVEHNILHPFSFHPIITLIITRIAQGLFYPSIA
jgi:hypothetical protein